jgi:hypothetical protein
MELEVEGEEGVVVGEDKPQAAKVVSSGINEAFIRHVVKSIKARAAQGTSVTARRRAMFLRAKVLVYALAQRH